MTDNPFDQFDAPESQAHGNPFDEFDAPATVHANPFDAFDNEAVADPLKGYHDEPAAKPADEKVPDAPVAPPEDSWLQIGRKAIENGLTAFKESVGGAVQKLGETAAEPNIATTMGQQELDDMNAPVTEALKDAHKTPGTVANIGKRIYDAAASDIRENAPSLNDGSVKDYSYQAAMSLVQILPTLAATVVTKSPATGLSLMAGQVYGQQYGQARNESGRTPEQASADATFYAMAETIPEEMPLGVLMQPGKKFLPKLLKSMGAEGLQEMFTQVLETAYDKGTVSPDMTWGEAWQQIRDAGIVGAAVGGGMHVVTHPFTRHEPASTETSAPQGKIAEASAQAVPVTQDDIDSPLPTESIAKGKQMMAEALARSGASDILAKNNWPALNSRVTVDMGDGQAPMGGTVADAFETTLQDLDAAAHGIRVQLDNGRSFEAFADEMQRAGVKISPEVVQGAQELSTKLDGQQQDPSAAAISEPPENAGKTIISDDVSPVEAPAAPNPFDQFDQADEGVAVPAATEPATAPTGDGTRAAPIEVSHPDHLAAAEKAVNTAPTEAQKEAGNYAKGHIKLHGLDIAIENPKGSERSGTGPDGTPWSVTLPAAYGYVKRTTGADGEQVDVYVGPNPKSSKVFVVDQKDADTGAFDEHKVLLAFDTQEQAIAAYNAAFSDGKGPARIGGVQEMNTLQFKAQLKAGKFDKPITGTKLPAVEPSKPVEKIIAPAESATDGVVVKNLTGSKNFSKKMQGMVDEARAKAPKGSVIEASYDANKKPVVKVTKPAEAKAPAEPAPKPKPTRKVIGKNRNGEEVSEDDRGVRSYVTDGVRVTEAVGMKPGSSEISIDKAGRRDDFKTAEETTAEAPAPEETRAAEYGSKNRIYRKEDAEKARAILRDKLRNQMSAGLDPELVSAGITLAGFHIEAGARKFNDYAREMIADLGERVRPYLAGWYMAVQMNPDISAEGMDDHATVVAAVKNFDAAPAAEPKAAPKEEAKTEKPDVAEAIRADLTDGKSFGSIREARARAAEVLGESVEPGKPGAKVAEEAVELGVVLAARDEVAKGGKDEAIYDRLVDLYSRQPNLGTRTSTSIEQQAYSTPVPLAFLADTLAGMDARSKVYEPTAGNGALLLKANPKNVTANELNEGRADALRRSLPGATITSDDASQSGPAPKSQDVVIANPPFGTVKDEAGASRKFEVDERYTTGEIDHAIAIKALEAMKDDGRAVLIVGGLNKLIKTEEARSDAYNGKAKREFYLTLYGAYNVVDHFTVAGELYAKQGAGWPVDVIVIDGRGKSSLRVPAADVPRIYNSWADLKEVLSADRGRVAGSVGEADRSDRVPAAEPARSDEGSGNGSGVGRAGERSNPFGVREPRGVRPVSLDRESGRGQLAEPAPREREEPAGDKRNGGPRGRSGFVDQEAPAQVAYEPSSSATGLKTLVPFNMRDAIQGALHALSERLADDGQTIDRYVADKLGYKNKAELAKNLSAEQVDAVALAIDNMDKGAGFILGDQTGVGKGRVVASVIRYAIKSGRPPIFVTEKPNLYADMYRDLTDTGIKSLLGRDVKILMTNTGESIPLSDDGSVRLTSSGKAKHDALLLRAGKEPGLAGHDVVFTTYNQMQTVKGQPTLRMQFLEHIAPGSIIVFDESHNAGGTAAGRGGEVKAKPGEETRATFARKIAALAHGVTYSSATYAKSPDVMDLYASTDMRLAVADLSKLADAISKGGVPMQQVVANMLAKAGQYIRREKSFDGIAYNTPSVKVDRDTYDRFSGILAAVQRFSEDHVKPATKNISKELKAEGKSLGHDNATGVAGAASTNFSAIMHNLVEQMLLSIKAEPAAARAIDRIKAGEKPVITVANTMESFLKDYAEMEGLKVGDPVSLDFSGLLSRYLERTRTITMKKPWSKDPAVKHYMTDDELGPRGVAAYRAAQKMIRDADLSSLPVSPIDMIRARIEQAGYKVSEITGRGLTLDYAPDGNAVLGQRSDADRSTAGKRKAIAGFNGGSIDAIIINQSGATGLSLHASEKFKDKRKRAMIIAQAERNIDTHMQMLGRVNRTGQVILPEYDQLVADVPAEKRPAAVLAKKMASLNANTTATRGSAVTAKDVPDFMNEYGDQVAVRAMNDMPELHDRLDRPLKGDEGGLEIDGAMRRLTGRIPLLPIKEQEELYSLLEAEYASLLAQKDAAGENALEAKTVDLDAKTINRQQVVAPVGNSDSPFADGVSLDNVDVKRIGKPLPGHEVIGRAADALDMERPETDGRKLTEALGDVQAAGRRAMEETRRKGLEDFRAYRSAVVDDMEPGETKDKMVARLTGLAGRWSRLIQAMPVGATVKLMQDEGNLYGVVTAVKGSGEARNPLALGTWKITFALADAARTMTLPMSQLDTGPDAAKEHIQVAEASRLMDAPIIDAFDNMQSESREKRQMVTGNLLAGFDHVKGRGAITNYTDHNGIVRQGILMPRGYDYGKQQEKEPVQFRSPDVAEAYLRLGKVLMEKGEGVQLSNVGGTLRIETPTSKGVGGRFYLNAAVKKAVGGDFVSVGGKMRAEVPMVDAAPVIEALQRAGAVLQSRVEDRADALKVQGGSQTGSAPKFSRGGRHQAILGEESDNPIKMVWSDKFAAKAQRVWEDLRARLDGYGLHDVQLAIPDKLENADASFLERLFSKTYGVHWQNLIVVALNDKASGRTKTLDHEAIHAMRALNLFKRSEWSILESRAKRLWRTRYNIDARYADLDEAGKNEEAIAEAHAEWQAHARGEVGAVARIFQKVRDALSAIRDAFVGHGFKRPDDVFGPQAREIFGNIDNIGRRTRFEGVDSSPKFNRSAPPAKKKEVSFSNPEVEKRFTIAKGGVGKQSLAERAREWGDYVKRGFTRHFINLPNTPEYADLHQQLRKLEAAPEYATDEIVRILRDMTGKMTTAELDLFSRKVILDDLAWEASRGRDLPFGLHQDDVPGELAKVNAALDKNPGLLEKVRQRKLMVSRIASQLVEAGVLLPEQVKNPAYYRHQVLAYAQAMEKLAADGEISAPRWASRINNSADINANLLEAEFDWLRKALIDIKTAQTIQWIKDSKHNVREAVLQEARDSNQRNIDEILQSELETGADTPLNDQWDDFKQTIGKAFSKVRQAILSGDLDIPPYLKDAADALVNRSNANENEGAAPPFEFLTWMLDNNKPGSMGAAMAFKAIAARKAWVKEHLGRRFADTSDIDGLLRRGYGPKDHVTWQPTRGKHMFTAKTLPEHVMDAYLLQMTQADDATVASMLGLTDPAAAKDLIKGFSDTIRSAASEALMVGSSRFQLVVPREVAETLDSFHGPADDDPISKVITVPLRGWKVWTLVSPRRVLKYNLNNLSGDIDAVIAGNPRVTKRLPEAVRELYSVMRGGKPSERYREAMARGVFGSGLTIQEVPDINRLDQFRHLLDPKSETPTQRWALNPIGKVWRTLKDYTQFRENWLRYAAYLDYADRIEAGESMKAIGYGGSIPAIVDAVADPKDRAAMLARDLMGDYGNVSAAGQTIRRSLIPFYSWMEINTKRYWRFTANAYGQGIGKGIATGTYVGARTTAYLALRMFAMYGLVQLFNYLFHRDEQERLDPEEQAQMHIILGQTPDGRVITLRTQGALSDALSWFGFEDVAASLAQIENGRASWGDVLASVATAPIKKVAGSITPFITEPVTLLTGRKFWPDPLHPTPVRDKWREAFAAFGLENEYDLATGSPSRGYGASLMNALVYSADPGEQAYNRIVGLAHEWQSKEKGTTGTSDFSSPRSVALYKWRKALRMGDMEAARDALEETKRLGVRPQDRRRSLKAMHPLGNLGLHNGDRARFMKTLTPHERALLDEALKWYGDTFVSGAKTSAMEPAE